MSCHSKPISPDQPVEAIGFNGCKEDHEPEGGNGCVQGVHNHSRTPTGDLDKVVGCVHWALDRMVLRDVADSISTVAYCCANSFFPDAKRSSPRGFGKKRMCGRCS